MDTVCSSSNILFQSVIVAIYNGEKWINDCFESIVKQDIFSEKKIEISVYNDCSTDNTSQLLLKWKKKLSAMHNISIVISTGSDASKGGKNLNFTNKNYKYKQVSTMAENLF